MTWGMFCNDITAKTQRAEMHRLLLSKQLLGNQQRISKAKVIWQHKILNFIVVSVPSRWQHLWPEALCLSISQQHIEGVSSKLAPAFTSLDSGGPRTKVKVMMTSRILKYNMLRMLEENFLTSCTNIHLTVIELTRLTLARGQRSRPLSPHKICSCLCECDTSLSRIYFFHIWHKHSLGLKD